MRASINAATIFLGLTYAILAQRRSAPVSCGTGVVGRPDALLKLDQAFADAGLMAAETDLQPAVGVKSPRRFGHLADDGGQRAADLRWLDQFGQLVQE